MMNETNHFRLHALVEGHVQGVGFRYFVLKNARSLGLTGWVRNTYSLQVEVLAEGPRPTLEKLQALLRQGPPSSVVTKLKADWLEATGEFSDFTVRF